MDPLVLLKSILLGLVEGLTEFLPVSSTGHLIVVQDWLRFSGQRENAFIIFIQLGSILAVVWLYRAKLLSIPLSWNSNPAGRRLLANMIIGTLPAAFIGLPTEKLIEALFFRPVPVAAALVIGGILIIWIERRPHAVRYLTVDDIPVRIALGIGAIQVLAVLFPGVSRSGATIMGALLLGLSRTAAAEFSFFLAIPAMTGAALVKLYGARDVFTMGDVPMFAAGFLVAFASALVVIRKLVSFVSRHSFIPFAWYRIIFGGVLLAMYWNRVGGF